jgi:uncharacterized membrane protein
MESTYLLLILLILCWTLNPFLKKNGPKQLSSEEYMFFNHLLCTIIILFYFFYLFFNNKCDIACINKISNKELIYSIFAAGITVLSSLLLIKLLKNNDASSIIPQVQPAVLLLTILIGYLIFNEKLTKNKVIGGSLIITGIYFINRK